MTNTSYCRKDIDNQGYFEYSMFFEGAFSVRMCGTPQEKIVKVEITEAPEPTDTTQWGFIDYNTGVIAHIFPLKEQVKMCSTDSFKSEISEGTGNIIPIFIKELEKE